MVRPNYQSLKNSHIYIMKNIIIYVYCKTMYAARPSDNLTQSSYQIKPLEISQEPYPVYQAIDHKWRQFTNISSNE